jgi:hypothetical protein
MPTISACVPRRGQWTDVDDRIQCGNSCFLNSDNPWTRVGVARARNEIRVVIWHNHTNQDSTKDVKEQDPVGDSLGGFGDGSMGIACLRRGYHHLYDELLTPRRHKVPTVSTPMKEKLALMKALMKPRKCPVGPVIPAKSVHAPGLLQ